MTSLKVIKTIRRNVIIDDRCGPVYRKNIPKGYSVVAINDREFTGFCECCGIALCVGDSQYDCVDGVILCYGCFKALRNAAELVKT